MRAALLAPLAAALILATAPAAQAGTVTLIGSNTTILLGEKTANEVNEVTLSEATGPSNANIVRAKEENSIPMTALEGCNQVDFVTADCPGDLIDGLAGFGGGADEFHNETWLPFLIDGGSGMDKMFGGSGTDTVTGGAGNDELHGGEGADTIGEESGFGNTTNGNDKLFGDGGDDLMLAGNRIPGDDNGAGADQFDGGTGVDSVDYSERTAPLKISEDAQANDGQGAGLLAEFDNVISAEIIIGGSAADRITGGGGANTLRGGLGGDDLDGGAGPDTLLGEEGDDTLAGGLDADLLVGGHGSDTASYADRIQPVTATLDGVAGAGDGVAGENDRIEDDVENLAGGFVADKLTGSGDANRISGAEGNDTVNGGGGDDTVDGQGDDDEVSGGTGNDTLLGGGGDDTIAARDLSKDKVGCGPGADSAAVDPFDLVAKDCESVSRGVGALSLPTKVKFNRKRVAQIPVGCPKAAFGGCARGVLVLTAKGKAVGSARFSIGAGDGAKVRMKLTRKQLKALRKRKPRSLAAKSPGADPALESVKVTLPKS
jgi:Ca2+-binding RTX toxin-like protein